MTAATAAQRGRRNRANGAAYEVKVANYLKTWWPDACRAVRNTQPDPGDIDGASPSFWWSVKNCQEERYTAWFQEMRDKAEGRIPLLVVRRRGHADPGRWWAFLTLGDLVHVTDGAIGYIEGVTDAYVRMELGTLVPLLVAYAQPFEVSA